MKKKNISSFTLHKKLLNKKGKICIFLFMLLLNFIKVFIEYELNFISNQETYKGHYEISIFKIERENLLPYMFYILAILAGITKNL